jgi:hypothetical protein
MFLIFTCIVSLALHKTMVMTVYNQYPGIELVSPIYFCNRGTCYEYPVKRTGTDAMMKIDFRFDPTQDEPGGILIYEMQRKGNARSDHQSSQVIENALKMIRLLIIWKMKRSGRPKVNTILVEYDNEFVLNEDKLVQLYNKMDIISSNYYKSTWFICDHVVLGAKYEVVRKEGLELNITISQGIENQNIIKPMWIDSKRQVSSLIVICPMLIYIASLTLQSVMNVVIHNQCTNIELTSPVYFIKDEKCHIKFPQQVNSKLIIRTSFVTGMHQSTFGGALLYHLQRKENTSMSAQLFIIWGFKFDRIYLHTWFIEQSAFAWRKDELKRLYHIYHSQYDIDANTREWLLNDHTRLETECETSHGGFQMEISVTEKAYLPQPRKPIWMDANRYVSTQLIPSYINLILSVSFFTIYSQS